MEKNTEIGTRVQEAIASLQSKGRIVRKTNELGRQEFYLITEGVSFEDGTKFNMEIPLALTDEFRDLGKYMELHRKKDKYVPKNYDSDRALRM